VAYTPASLGLIRRPSLFPSVRRRPVLLGTSASALLFTLTHAPLSFAPLGFIALVPWAHATRGRGIACGAWTGGAIGLLFGLAVSRWIPEALSVRGAGFVPSILGWLLTSLWAGALPLGFLCGAIRALDRVPLWIQIPAAAGLAFTIDVARTSHVAGVPWALLGHTQAPLLGIAQLAVVGGVPLLSALVVAVNLAIAQTFFPDRTPARIGAAAGGAATCLALALCGVPLAATLNAAGIGDAPTEPLRALLVRHRTSYEERWIPELQRTHLARLALYTERELRTHGERPDLVVWPENSLIADLDHDTELREALLAAVRKFDVDLVLGVLSPTAAAPGPGAILGSDRQALRSQALWISPEDGIVDAFAKTTGVPVVETSGTAGFDRALRALFGLGTEAPRLEPSSEERPLRGRVEVAVALCYEAIFPNILAARRTSATRAILNPSSDAWLPDPSLVSQELMSYSSFRAIEARLPLLRIADAGESVALDAFGRRIATLPEGHSGGVWVEWTPTAEPRALERVGLMVFGLAIWAAVGIGTAIALRRIPSQ
jgi:apolipoprotein N-acyltransferase